MNRATDVGGGPAGADASSTLDLLERRRLLALRGALAALAIGVLAGPIGLLIGEDGNETREALGGACFYVAIIGLIAVPMIVRAWQRFMQRRMLDEAAAGRPEIRHIDGRHHAAAARGALASDAFDLGAFGASGLAEPFESAVVDHVLAGRSEGVPFALAELRLLDDRRYRVFRGVLASFRLDRPRPGLTVVARDRGLLGNLLARTGSGIDPVPLEDPSFEGVFEAYGTDQVQARVVLTTTMLERLKQLDELAHARGFTCAFRGPHLMIAFRGMRWRCPFWRILQPVGAWLPGYRRWIEGLIELPARIAATLNLQAAEAARPPATAAAPAPQRAAPLPAGGRGVAVIDSSNEVFSGPISRLVGEAGTGLIMIASGTLFGGLAAFFGSIGLEHGFDAIGGWYTLTMVALGLAYGAYAISVGLYALGRLAWTWGAPLRGLQADGTRRPSRRLWNGLS